MHIAPLLVVAPLTVNLQAIQVWDNMEREARNNAANKNSGNEKLNLSDRNSMVPNLPEHCIEFSASLEETRSAVEKCQVGRGSTSYSLARGESVDETLKRRRKEIEYENSDEMKAQRGIIKKALGSVMG